NAGLEGVVALDDALVNPRAALHIVGFDSQQLLESVSRAIDFHGPNFHFSEPLAAILGFDTERLLRDERVRTNGAGMNLVRHQVSELHHIDEANDDFLVELLARATVVKLRLAVL